jgi:hypothetical protein
MIEAVFRQYSFESYTDHHFNDEGHNTSTADILLVAAARYLSAHCPTMRSQGHTYRLPIIYIMENIYLKDKGNKLG